MTVACTVGSYALPHFSELQILSLRRVFGEQTPILISDDKSSESPVIESLADKYGVAYYCSSARRNHFSGDVQAICNALQFAKEESADVAVKISQRLILCDPAIRQHAERYLSQDEIAIAMPTTPPRIQICGAKGFLNYPWLTDVIFMRTDRMISPEIIRDEYEAKWKAATNPIACIPELVFRDMIQFGPLKGKAVEFSELTRHGPGMRKNFLRRYMSTSFEYRRFAQSLGLDAHYQTGEWRQLDTAYSPRPRA